jgi:hypothetical protein
MRFMLLFLAALMALAVLPEAASAQSPDVPGFRYPPPPPNYEDRRYQRERPPEYEDRRYRRERPPEYYREAPPPGYRQRSGGSFCAREGQFCQFQGPAVVRYGAAGRFVRRQAFNGIPCNNQAFGDPAVGLEKACYLD